MKKRFRREEVKAIKISSGIALAETRSVGDENGQHIFNIKPAQPPGGNREITEDVNDEEVLRRPGAKQGQRRTRK